MTVLQGVLASAGLVAVLMGLIWRVFVHFDAKNEQAHAAITENVQAVDDRADSNGLTVESPEERERRVQERMAETAAAREAARPTMAGQWPGTAYAPLGIAADTFFAQIRTRSNPPSGPAGASTR